LTPEELEVAVLSSLSTLDAIRIAEAMGICEDSFQVPANAAAWQYIIARARRGELATSADVKAMCGVMLQAEVTDAHSLAEMLVRRTAARKARTVLMRYARHLAGDDNTDPMPAIRGIVTELSDINRGVVGHVHFWDSGAQDRFERIRQRVDAKMRGDVIGIPTGLEVFDRAGDTWQPGELIGILGMLNVGKSWLLMYFAAVAYMADKRVVILSPESTIDTVEMRMDTLIGHMMGYTLSNDALRRGSIDMEQYAKFAAELALSGRHDLVIRDSGDRGVFTVDDIVAQAYEHRPDLVCIDGFHLIKGAGRSWENMKEAAERVKGLAQDMGITVIAASQVQRDALIASDDTPDLGQVAYGLGMIEAADRVIALAERRGDQYQRVFKVPKVRSGKRITRKQYLKFDVDVGDIGWLNPNIDVDTGEVNFD
jgi:archaellum biogenesis ATPase FlaH